MKAITGGARNGLDRYFGITERGSTLGREVLGGLATFFAMAYIVVLNPLIIGTVEDGDGQFVGDVTGDPGAAISLVAAATALLAGVLTILMGAVGRYPYALATGLGLNAYVAFGIVSPDSGLGLSWEEGMGLVVVSGLLITVLVLTGFRTAVFRAIPVALKAAIGVGIGLFIALVGFVNAGFVRRVPDEQGTNVPVQLGQTGQLAGWPVFVFILGLLLTALLVARGVKGAILIGIATTTVVAIVVEAVAAAGPATGAGGDADDRGWGLNVPEIPTGWGNVFGAPDLGLLGQFSLLGGFTRAGVVAAVLVVFSLLLADFFDTMGTIVGVGAQANLLDRDGNLPGVREVLLVDSLGAAAGGAASVSSNTTYVESAAGVGEGARTGLANLVTGVLFLVAMFLAPLVTVVPFEAATPALVIVGFLMMTQIRSIDFSDFDIAIPAFLTIVIMPFTYSITNGIGAGFVSYVVIKTVRGRAREVHPLLWVVALLFVAYYGIVPIQELLGVA